MGSLAISKIAQRRANLRVTLTVCTIELHRVVHSTDTGWVS